MHSGGWMDKAILIGAQQGSVHTLKRKLVKPVVKYRSNVWAWGNRDNRTKVAEMRIFGLSAGYT
jgi:hypothetical protein